MKYLIFISLGLVMSCSSVEETSSDEPVNEEPSSNFEMLEIDRLTVEITGIAANRKGGAVVIADSNQEHYWIEGLASWDDEFLEKKVVVKGVLEVRDDAPVVLDTGEIKSQGIPVHTEEEMESARERFWILDPSWKLAD